MGLSLVEKALRLGTVDVLSRVPSEDLAYVARYARAFRRLLALAEEHVLAVCHSLPVAYAIGAGEGRAPEPKVPLVENAHPYPFTRGELERVVETLEGWCASPSW